MKPRFCLPVILNQPDYKSADRVSYCPQEVNLFRPPRLVDSQVSYCPQDVSLFRPDRTVNAQVSYCPQDTEMFYPLWSPADIATDLWIDASDTATITGETINDIDPNLIFVRQINDKSGNGNHFLNDYNFYYLVDNQPTLKPGPYPIPKLDNYNGLPAIRFYNEIDSNQNNNLLEKTFLINNNINFFKDISIFNYFSVIIDFRQGGLNNIIAPYFSAPNDENNINSFFYFYQRIAHEISLLESKLEIIGSIDTPLLPGQYFQSYFLGDATLINQYEPFPVLSSSEISADGQILADYSHSELYLGTNGYEFREGTAYYSNGYLCELIIIKSAIFLENKQKIEGYLAHKWGLTSQLDSAHPYKIKPPRNLPIF